MSDQKNTNFSRLGIIAGILLFGLALGYVTGSLDLVLTILKATGLLLLSITILVTVHELGHFLAAKAFGVRVEVFSIGFPPRLFSFKKGETEYQIGVTPLGGYVKITGMIDESLDQEVIKKEKARENQDVSSWQKNENPEWAPKPYEFRSKPVWQRLIIMTGGVIMNIILGVGILSGIKYIYGERLIPVSEVQEGIEIVEGVESLGHIIGFQTGDKLLSFRGEELYYFEDYADPANLLEEDAYFEVERGGEKVKLEVPSNIQKYFNDKSVENTLFLPDMAPILVVGDSVRDEKTRKGIKAYPGHQAGLCTGDQVLTIDSVEVKLFSQLRALIKERTYKTFDMTVLRDGNTIPLVVVLDTTIMGVKPYYQEGFATETKEYTVWEALKAGFFDAFGIVRTNYRGFRNAAVEEGVNLSDSVMGPFQIAKVILDRFEQAGFLGLLHLTAILSMILAFVNILPIPALDGGHVLFLLIEGITRREPSVKVRLIAQQIGMVFIIGLMLLILLNDSFRLLGG